MTRTKVEINRYESLARPVKVVCLVLFTIGVGFFIFYIFAWSIRGWVLEAVQYYYILYATFCTCVFLTMPARKKDRHRLPWYDLVIAAVVFVSFTYFAIKAPMISRNIFMWVPPSSTLALVLASIITLLSLESGRRMAGLPFTIVCLILGIYPLFAENMPGILCGIGLSFDKLVGSFVFGQNGMLGIPARVAGEILIGFLIFAGMLMASGAGAFFLNLALALMGRFRGGPAKVAVLASGFFGSLSGAPMANIVATGSVTIPAMKRMGYPSHYAGAIEAVASTGGMIMPPIMGAAAFIMAIMTDKPYAVIAVAAIIPAILYYYGLMVQVDAYAARVGLKGLPREEIPSLLKTLKEGWPYIVILAFLVFGLLYMRWGVRAPVYASGLMFVLSFTNRKTMMTPRSIISTLAIVGNLITYMMAVLLPVGLLMIGLTVTGTLTAITAQLVTSSGSAVIIVLITVVVCYLFGMIGITLLPYIVLAVTVIPALVITTGVSLIGAHLFVIYCLLMAGITPPVAINAFVAAGVAGAPPMKTAWTATRLAIVLYFVPFFFLSAPALVLEGPILESIYLFVLCLVGIWILASGLEGYLLKVGRLKLWSRVLLFASGFLIAFPGYGQILTWWMTSVIGIGIAVLVIATIVIRREMYVPVRTDI